MYVYIERGYKNGIVYPVQQLKIFRMLYVVYRQKICMYVYLSSHYSSYSTTILEFVSNLN